MPEISAADAARTFAELLDAVERRHEQYTIVRPGRVAAQISPVTVGRGADVKALLRRARPDRDWAVDLRHLRNVVRVDARS